MTLEKVKCLIEVEIVEELKCSRPIYEYDLTAKAFE